MARGVGSVNTLKCIRYANKDCKLFVNVYEFTKIPSKSLQWFASLVHKDMHTGVLILLCSNDVCLKWSLEPSSGFRRQIWLDWWWFCGLKGLVFWIEKGRRLSLAFLNIILKDDLYGLKKDNNDMAHIVILLQIKYLIDVLVHRPYMDSEIWFPVFSTIWDSINLLKNTLAYISITYFCV